MATTKKRNKRIIFRQPDLTLAVTLWAHQTQTAWHAIYEDPKASVVLRAASHRVTIYVKPKKRPALRNAILGGQTARALALCPVAPTAPLTDTSPSYYEELSQSAEAFGLTGIEAAHEMAQAIERARGQGNGHAKPRPGKAPPRGRVDELAEQLGLETQVAAAMVRANPEPPERAVVRGHVESELPSADLVLALKASREELRRLRALNLALRTLVYDSMQGEDRPW